MSNEKEEVKEVVQFYATYRNRFGDPYRTPTITDAEFFRAHLSQIKKTKGVTEVKAYKEEVRISRYEEDRVPAMLTPGQTDLPRHLVEKYGTNFLDAINQGAIDPTQVIPTKGMTVGGVVRSEK